MSKPTTSVDCTCCGSSLVARILIEELRDTEAIQHLKVELLSAVAAKRPRNVILDLERVKFIGSVGFLVFLRLRREPGVERIVLCNLGEQVRGAFLICRLLSEEKQRSAPFEEAETVEHAISKCET